MPQKKSFLCSPLMLLNYVLLFFELYFMWMLWNSYRAFDDWTKPMFPFIVLSILLNSFTFRQKKIQLFDFRLVYMLLTYIFMYGRILLIHMGNASILYWSLHKIVDPEAMFRASLFVPCATQAMFLGLMSGKEYVIPKTSNSEFSKQNLSAIKNTGIILLIIAIPCRLITDSISYLSTNLTGSYTNIQSSTGLFDDFAFLLVPGLICIMEAKPNARKAIMIITLVYFVIIMSLTGDRRYYVSSIIALLLYYLCRTQIRIKPLRLILIELLCLLFLNFLEVLRKMRLSGLTDLGTFFSSYGMDILNLTNVFFDVFEEFGISLFSVVLIIQYIPSSLIGFQYGLTFLKSIPTVLPIGFMLNNLISPSSLINDYCHLPVGGTILGDAYADFGFLAFLAIFLLGAFLKKLFDRFHYSKEGFNIILYFTCVSTLVNLVRCTIMETVRPLVWCILIPVIIYKSFSKSGI